MRLDFNALLCLSPQNSKSNSHLRPFEIATMHVKHASIFKSYVYVKKLSIVLLVSLFSAVI